MSFAKVLRRVLFVALFALSIYTWLRPQDSGSDIEFESVSMIKARSDYYLEGFKILQSDADGQTEYALSGELLSYDPSDDLADLSKPVLKMLHPDGLTWRLTAEQGVMPRDGRQITLSDSVELIRTLADGSTPSTMTTEIIEIDINAGKLRGDVPVLLEGPGWQVKALGMTADTGQGALQLIGRTHGLYQTQVD